MEELKNYLNELIKLRRELKLINWSDDSLADISTRIFISQNIQLSKEKNIEKMNQKSEELATPQQKFVLKKLGFEGDINKVTKKEAFKIIKESKENGNKY